eukprot:1381645-Amorphochlora_amoeboformis.AAC.1
MTNDKGDFSDSSFKKFEERSKSSNTHESLGKFGSVTWRDVTVLPVTTGYCRLLSDETISKNHRNLQQSPAICSIRTTTTLQHISISTPPTAPHAI